MSLISLGMAILLLWIWCYARFAFAEIRGGLQIDNAVTWNLIALFTILGEATLLTNRPPSRPRLTYVSEVKTSKTPEGSEA